MDYFKCSDGILSSFQNILASKDDELLQYQQMLFHLKEKLKMAQLDVDRNSIIGAPDLCCYFSPLWAGCWDGLRGWVGHTDTAATSTCGSSHRPWQGFTGAVLLAQECGDLPGESGRAAVPRWLLSLSCTPPSPLQSPCCHQCGHALKQEVTSTSLYCFLNKLPLPWTNIVL